MQSFLQYRRFGKYVTRQYERDKSKAEALAASPSSSDAENTPQGTDDPDHVDSRDPEKGEQSNGHPLEPQDHPETHDPEKQEEVSGGYAPIQTASIGRRASQSRQAPEDMSTATTVPTGKSLGTALGTTLTGIEVRDRSTKEGGDGRVFVVGYEGDKDIMNPHNWSFGTRFAAT